MHKAFQVKSPNKVVISDEFKKIFLAGSIEMGTAENWQQKIFTALHEYPLAFLNPRRDDWDSTWEQKITNTNFNEQVNWELTHLDLADKIVMYFDPNTKSPISLLELGLYANTGKLIVCCPEPFWRKGNVDIVCEKYGIKQVDTLDEVIEFLKTI